MINKNSESFKRLEALVADTGNTYSFDGESSVKCSYALMDIIKDAGLNPLITEEFKKCMTTLLNIEVINMPDLENNRFILTPNHVSDFDALFLGTLHKKIKIVSKNAWTDNEKLKRFLNAHFDLYGFDRASLHSLRSLLTDSINYFNNNNENKHFLIFSQGTISDFNNNSLERISPVAQKISIKTNIPIVNMFIEQASLYEKTRIVFDEPMMLSGKDDFRKIWLERETIMQNSLIPAARRPNLSNKHSNNNKQGDTFF